MKYTDVLINNYDDAAFQTAFRAYLEELGCRVTNWDGLFAGMGERGREYTWTRRDAAGQVTAFAAWMNADEHDAAWVRRDEEGRVVGFIQFTPMELSSWFFRVQCGFIREFWVAPELRRQGHGAQLLQLAEETLTDCGCAYAILTTDTAPDFYRRHGYGHLPEMTARNNSPVFVKRLAVHPS